MKDAERLRRRRLVGPEPWRPDPDPVWLFEQLRDVDLEAVGPLDPNLAERLTARVRRLSTTVSVVIPAWNRAHSIERAVDSVLAQTYGATEIIVIDDGSTDGTPDLLAMRYQEHVASGLLHVLRCDHRGVSQARNEGLLRATGEIVTYLDSDNEWLPDYLAMVVSVFAEDASICTMYCALQSYVAGRADLLRATEYDRRRLLHNNFIDLNVFAHRRSVYEQLGGFDTELKRLVDWDLILRYTALYPPAFARALGVRYHLDEAALDNITYRESYDENYAKIATKYAAERRQYGADPLKVGYVAWDYPALSQTFFHREVQLLVDAGIDVIVYWSATPDAVADIDPRVRSYEVRDAAHLAELLVEHERNICHSHFIYPATTLLTYPACVEAGIEFTFMPHAVDLFQHDNRRRNRLAEVANHRLCRRVFVYGDHHASFLESNGVDPSKISYMFQAVDFEVDPAIDRRDGVPFADLPTGLVVARFIEKKGLSYLFEAMAELGADEMALKIVGYGPLDKKLREQVADLGLHNVTFLGPVRSEQELHELYMSVDFLVVPSVVAANGDMDGFPTVILEAMSIGLPVVTTDVSAVPDYINDEVEAIVTDSADVGALADGLRRLIDMSDSERATLTFNAARFVSSQVGTRLTVSQLLDEWQGYSIDILLVTFDREGYRSIDETVELIRRVQELTTTRYRLIVVDNESDEVFHQALRSAISGFDNVTFLPLGRNVMCGPASNVALHSGSSEFAVYLCSKESFPLKRGWERPFINHFREHPRSVIAGQLAVMPGCATGARYAAREDFARYRLPEFAVEEPTRIFRHVQGGLFALRRDFAASVGAFNELIPHGGMDVEFSYFVEAAGYELGVIPELVSLTNKTLPRVVAHLDSSSVAVHPLTCGELGDIEHLGDRFSRSCNCCGWRGDVRSSPLAKRLGSYGCPKCGSSSLSRLLFRQLAMDHRVHSGFPLFIVSFDESVQRILGRQMFAVRTVGPAPSVLQRMRNLLKAGPAITVIDHHDLAPEAAREIADVCLDASLPGSALIASVAVVRSSSGSDRVRKTMELTCSDRAVQFGLERWAQAEVG